MLLEQNNVKTAMSQPNAILLIKNLLTNTWSGIRSLASKVAEVMDFCAPNGDKQISSCVKALRDLEKQGKINLDQFPLKEKVSDTQSVISCQPVRMPKNDADEEISLTCVRTKEEKIIYQGFDKSISTTDLPNRDILVGRQVKYVITSGEDVIGIIGFDSPTRNDFQRDSSLKFNVRAKSKFLHYFVNLRKIKMANGWNAYRQKAINLALERISDDFNKLYNYKPVLIETTVDQKDSLVDDLYRSKWELCGQGRTFSATDAGTNNKKTKKKKVYSESYDQNIHGPNVVKKPLILIYTLDSNKLNEILGLNQSAADNIHNSSWAKDEFKYTSFDKRAANVLINIVEELAKAPGSTITALAKGATNIIKKFNRFMQSKNERINFSSILDSHFKRTAERSEESENLENSKDVLWIGDTSEISLVGSNCPGLGLVGTNHQVPGFNFSPILGVKSNGEVLGLLSCSCESPIRRDKNENNNCKELPIEEKNDFVWVANMEKVDAISRANPNRSDILIYDRGADFCQFFLERNKSFISTELIIRAKSNRVVNNEEIYDGESQKIFDFMRKRKYAGTMEVIIRVNDNNKKKPKKKTGKKKKSLYPSGKRHVTLRIHYCEVEFRVPSHLVPIYGKKTIKLNAVLAREYNPPQGQKRIEWLIWTTLPIKSLEDAVTVVAYYAKRWTIEEFFRILKTVCNVEKIRYRDIIRMKRAIAIIAIVAWRCMHLLSYARSNPDTSASKLFDPVELKLLKLFAKDRCRKEPITCEDAVILVSMLGGYIPDRKDRRPGYEIFSVGYKMLQNAYYFNRMELKEINE